MASSSIIPLKGQDFVGGIGKSSELQMHRTAGYFPLPWPAKESSFKTHLPVNILAWLWVISPVSTRPIRAWRRTCTNPKTDLATSDFPCSRTTSCLIGLLIHPVAGSLILKGFLTLFPLNFCTYCPFRQQQYLKLQYLNDIFLCSLILKHKLPWCTRYCWSGKGEIITSKKKCHNNRANA